MKLLTFLFTLSESDKETLKDWLAFIMPVITLLSNFFSPIIGFVIGILTMLMLYERWKYYRNENRKGKGI